MLAGLDLPPAGWFGFLGQIFLRKWDQRTPKKNWCFWGFHLKTLAEKNATQPGLAVLCQVSWTTLVEPGSQMPPPPNLPPPGRVQPAPSPTYEDRKIANGVLFSLLKLNTENRIPATVHFWNLQNPLNPLVLSILKNLLAPTGSGVGKFFLKTAPFRPWQQHWGGGWVAIERPPQTSSPIWGLTISCKRCCLFFFEKIDIILLKAL